MVASTKERVLNELGRGRISKSGQVTLPAEIRRELGAEIGDTIVFSRDSDGVITLRRPRSATQLAGILGPRPQMDVETLIQESTKEGMERRVNRWLK